MKENKPGPKGGPETPSSNGPSGMMNFLIVCFVLTYAMNTFMSSMSSDNRIQIRYSQFIKLVESGNVDKAQVEDEEILITLKEDADKAETDEILKDIMEPEKETAAQASASATPSPITQLEPITSEETIYYTGRIDDPELIERFTSHDVNFYRKIVKNNPLLDFVSTWVFPILLMYMLYMFFMRSMMKRMGSEGGLGGMMNVGKSKAKMYSVEKETGVTFADVAGQDEAKESLNEMVDFLNRPERYQEIGAKQPKGVLLVGPPGTGKTLLAKAVAGEAGVPFFSLSGSEFVEMFVGVGASRVRDLFAQATKQAPCIVFIDEIDAIGKSRDNQVGGNDEREQTLNQLLSEMDGFDSSRGIIILAATNRPEILDKALLRPGRFDRRVIVEKPDLPGREAILRVHAEKVKLGDSINLREIALATSGATGADLANMVNEAALLAVKMGRDRVTQADIMEAVEVVIAGKEKKDRILSPKEKKMVAFHEVGHALASALQKDSQPVQKITIVPRTMGALGYTMQMPEEERYLTTKSEMLAQITVLLSGRAAEELIFNEISTGASNDIERATQLARSMVTQYGMSEKFDMVGLESIQNRYLDGRTVMNCSEATGASIDDEVGAIIRECHQKGLQLLTENKERLIKISEFLVEKETITGEQFMEILKSE